MRFAIASVGMLLASAACFAEDPEPQNIVQSSAYGLLVKTDAVITARLGGGEAIWWSGANLLDASWCAPDLEYCVEDIGQGCPMDECIYRLSIHASDGCTIGNESGNAIVFDAFIQYNFHSGSWCGPADWSLDGSVNSADFFAFLSDFFDADSDFNMDGLTNTADFFDFLTAFLSG